MRKLRPHQLVQSVKAVCAFLGGIETLDVHDSCDALVRTCLEMDRDRGNVDHAGRIRPDILKEVNLNYHHVHDIA